MLGYDHVVDIDTTHVRRRSRRPPSQLLRERPAAAVLPLGRASSRPTASSSSPPRCATRSTRCRRANLPDTPETRRDMAAFKASARSLDQGVGAVLNALDEHDLADDTLVDPHHRPRARVPGRQGDADRPRDRRAADHARPGRLPRRPRLGRARLPDRPLPDAVRARRRSSRRRALQGRSLLPARARARSPRSTTQLFAELTYHAAYEPQRAIRTQRHKYIRRFGDRPSAGAAQRRRQPDARTSCSRAGWADRALAARGAATTSCSTRARRATSSATRTYAAVLDELRERLDAWMRETDDPLLARPRAGARRRGAQRPRPGSRPPRRPRSGPACFAERWFAARPGRRPRPRGAPESPR